MQLIDKKAIEEFGIPSLTLMENAGRAVYDQAKKMLSLPASKPGKVLCLCGKGNNGGDGLVAARYLREGGIDVSVYLLCEEKRLKKDPLINFNKLRNMNIPTSCVKDKPGKFSGYGLIIDAIFGTGFKGRPDKYTSGAIEAINKSNAPVLSVDVPSGLNATTGESGGISVKAACTITFGLAKTGFYKESGPGLTGEVIVKNIGFPTSLLTNIP